MQPVLAPLILSSPMATNALARALAPALRAGDVLLLDGPIGAGKTHFARALIQALLPAPEDVPSPTFTLVQTYDAPGFEIWHADLYRLSHPDEAVELGLDEAFEHALCLVEWPERLGGACPPRALCLCFAHPGPGEADESRALSLLSDDPAWRARLAALNLPAVIAADETPDA